MESGMGVQQQLFEKNWIHRDYGERRDKFERFQSGFSSLILSKLFTTYFSNRGFTNSLFSDVFFPVNQIVLLPLF